MTLVDRPLLVMLLAAGALAAGVFWAIDDLKEWLQPHVDRVFQTSGIPGAMTCTLPTEHEQLVIVLSWQQGKLRHRCMFVGSRGTYSRKDPGA